MSPTERRPPSPVELGGAEDAVSLLVHEEDPDGGGKARGGREGWGGTTRWQASASVMKAIMGAGSFALPWAFSKMGYVAGPAFMLALMALSVQSVKMLVASRRMVRGATATSYVDVAEAAFGAAGARLTYAASVSASVGVCGSYLVFIAANLLSLLPSHAEEGKGLSQGALVFAVLPVAVLLSAVRDVGRFALASLLGDASVILGMLVVLIYGAAYVENFGAGCIAAAPMANMPLAFGAVGFLFFIHFLVIPIESSMMRPEEFDSVVNVTFLACALVSAGFGVVGYLFFGEETEQIVILNVKGSLFVSVVKILLCIDLLLTYPVVMRPSIEIVEKSVNMFIKSRFFGTQQTSGPFWMPCCSVRLCVCLFLGIVAAMASLFVPAFGLLSSLVGGISQTFLGFIMPPLMMQRLQRLKNQKASLRHDAHVPVMVTFGVFMMCWTLHSTWSELQNINRRK